MSEEAASTTTSGEQSLTGTKEMEDFYKSVLEVVPTRSAWLSVFIEAQQWNVEYREDLTECCGEVKAIAENRLADMKTRQCLIKNGWTIPTPLLENHKLWMRYFKDADGALECAIKTLNWLALWFDDSEKEKVVWHKFWDLMEGKVSRADGGGRHGPKMAETLGKLRAYVIRTGFLDDKLNDTEVHRVLDNLNEEPPAWMWWTNICQ